MWEHYPPPCAARSGVSIMQCHLWTPLRVWELCSLRAWQASGPGFGRVDRVTFWTQMCTFLQKNHTLYQKTQFWLRKNTWGVFLGGIKSPCGNGDTHSLGLPFKNTVFSHVQTLGRVFGGIKKRRRQLAPATPRFYLFDSSFSVKKKKKAGFPPPAKGVER